MGTTVGDLPDFMILSNESLIFGHRTSLCDEPAHLEDLIFAVIIVPEEVLDLPHVSKVEASLPPACTLSMLAAIVFAHDLGAVVVPRRPRGDSDSFGVWFQVTEPFH